MPDFSAIGRFLIIIGVMFLLIGGALIWIGKSHSLGGLGRLPGDLYIERKNFSFYLPITTSLVMSVVLSLIVWLLTRR